MTDSQCFSFARRDLLCYTDTASMNVNYMQYAGRRICAKFGTNRSTDGRRYEETEKKGQTVVNFSTKLRFTVIKRFLFLLLA